jgi:putative NADH-flavin reductase
MRVLIFAASGAIGGHVREQARAAGHDLVLFARDPAKLEPLGLGETVVQGDISDGARVAEAVTDVDAVISVLGPSSNSADQVVLFESFARTLIAAMKTHGVKRLVAISGGAASLTGEHKPLRARIASSIVRMFVGHVVRAKQRELDIIAASDVDWIAPRPPRVIEGAETGSYQVGDTARGMRISQGDLAHFMVTALTDNAYVRQAPFIAS